MKNQAGTKRLPTLLSILWIALTVFLAPDAVAGDIEIVRLGHFFEVRGGAQGQPWHIRYAGKGRQLVLAGPGATAYFTHGSWLRRVDVEKGVVTGRWRFPGSSIDAIEWKDQRIQVSVVEEQLTRVFDFNPNAPEIAFWPTTSILASTLAIWESPSGLGMTQSADLQLSRWRAANEGTPWLPELENTARRDPLSPWLLVELGFTYAYLEKPGSFPLYEKAVRLPVADYSEAFRISAFLDKQGHKDLAREAFERGYEKFWQQGNDPRLVTSLLSRLVMYSPPPAMGNPEYIDRVYRLAPWVEAGEYAWESYANLLGASGEAPESRQWNARAEEARSNAIFPVPLTLAKWLTIVSPVIPAALLSAALYLAVLFVRYLPERRVQVRAQKQTRVRSRFGFLNMEYWTRGERIAFLTVMCAGWLACGLVASRLPVLFGFASMPLGVTAGSFGGPASPAVFEKRFSKGPERDLLLAMAYQHDGQPEKAAALYRRLPEFPESWNNLGSILKDAGQDAEARQAFERALQLDPEMAEPRWNLGNGPSDLWTELHQKYLPNRPMLAPPFSGRVLRAMTGDSLWQMTVHLLKGPLGLVSGDGFYFQRQVKPIVVIMTALFVVALLLMAVPQKTRDVTQPPYRYQKVLELLLPGTAPQWSYLGGVVLIAWSYSLLQCWPVNLDGIEFIFGRATPDIQRTFGVPADPDVIQRLQAPAMGYIYGAVIALWLANAYVVWRARAQRIQED